MNRGPQNRIALLTGSSLCHNPRAAKEAAALADAGYAVSVLGAWHDPALKARDLPLIESAPFKFIAVLDSTLPGPHDKAARWGRRVRRKTADVIYGATGLESPLQLGLSIRHLLREALRIRADLYVAHSEPALYVGRELLRRGRRVGVDMEDWFSEDLTAEARRRRPLRLLRSLERELLVHGAYASCPSHAMSRALADTIGCTPPSIIYNAFPWSERAALDGKAKDRIKRDAPSICWYSQTIGHGRGLEDLLAAVPLLKHEVEIHLRGNPADGFEDWARSQLPECWRHRLFFHGLVANDQLLSRIAEHDVGFAGEMKFCRSRDLTVTNKIMHYLLAGLAVVASDTAGQGEIASRAPAAVLLYPSGDAAALAQALDRLLGSPDRMQSVKAAAVAAAQQDFCWERQETVLQDAVARALRQRGVELRRLRGAESMTSAIEPQA
jgi:glycosyltransferase involved in cell wall biosynthesis